MSYQSETSDPLASEPLPTPPTPSGSDQTQAKKKLHIAFFFILVGLAGVAGFSAFLNFCISMSQVSSSTVLANGDSIWLNSSYSCTDVKTFLPLRWEISTQRGIKMMCPWPASNSGFRSFMSIVAMADMVLFVLALKKSENSIINWSFLGSCGLIAFLYLIVTIVDGSSLSKANGFCNDGMPQAIAIMKPEIINNATIECFPEPFTGTVFSDVFAFIMFPALAAYFFYYQRRTHRTGETTIPSDDETKPLATAEVTPKKKMFTASEINDESLTQDVTGANPFDPKTGMVDPDSV